MRENLKHLFLLVLLAGMVCYAYAQEDPQEDEPEEREYYNKEDNAVCFRCHGNQFFMETDEELGEQRFRKMFKGLIIDSVKYYDSNHWSFACTDCHSYDYNEYPHSTDLHFEVLATCEDCHGGDEAMEKYNFDGIVEEYNKSHHTRLPDYPYTCWSCHDPHSFKMEVRSENRLTQVVAYDNGMCLQCHGMEEYAELLLGVSPDPMIEIHSWLPGTENHLRHVRCIECHAEIREDVMVAHNILPKEQAINSCEECHSSDSRLLHTLYKYQIQEGKMERGILGAMSTGEIFVVGSNRNQRLNLLSLIIFAGLGFFVMVHVFFRIIKK